MFSTSCVYGIRALLYLTHAKPGTYVTTQTISQELGVSYSFLGKVLQQLTRHGITEPLRGPQGGVTLARPSDQITLGEVILAIEGAEVFEGCVRTSRVSGECFLSVA